jgi:tetratricopeptide (TPR) repeat protein
LTVQYLQRMGSTGLSTRTLLDQGNLFAEEKQWEYAVRAYEMAWTHDRRSAAALYLLGWAKTKRGEEAEGRQCKELALTIPLADGESRHELIQTLVRLHESDEAARQRQILLRTVEFDDRALVQTLLEIGGAAPPASDGPAPDAAFQRAALLLLGSNIFLRDVRYYLEIPQVVHRTRAMALLRAGKTAEAIDELHRAEALTPENVQLSLDCDAALRKQGAATEADALYHRMAERLEADCCEFPRWGGCHNDLAWLSANLDRDLDRALAHAQRAVELEPQSAGILDTLAEVHYRRGNRAEAVRLAKRCIELDGQLSHYKEQLARFEK